MAADHVSLSELSEFLDDSDGHRLAQFLQKKSGAVQPGRRRIFDCEPERFSLNVRLRRISSPHPPVIRDPPIVDVVNNCIKEGPVCSEEAQGEDELQQSESPISKCADIKLEISNQELRDSRTSVSETSRQSEIFEEDVQLPIICEQTQRPETTSMPVSPESSPQRLPENSVQPLAAIAEQQRPCCTPVPSFLSQPGTPHSVRRQSLRSPLAKISRSGAVRSENHLRRQVLQGLSNKGNYGRRNLLKGFENTLSSPDFAPQICSTPMHHKPAKTLETIPPRRSNVPTADQPMQTAEHNSIPGTLQPSENEHMTQKDLPSIRDMIAEALEGAVKQMKSIENTMVRIEAAPESVGHSNVLPQTQELLRQAQAHISTSHPVNKSQEPNTQELLHEVQKALICIQKSQSQVPKIVIPVNQTFNNAPTPSTKQHNDKEHVSLSDGLHRTHETENEQTLVNTMIRNNSPSKCHGTFMRSNTINYKVSTDSVRDNNIITNNSHSHESQWQTFTKPNTHTEKVVVSALREPSRNECRSPLRPINQEAYTDNNRTQNECRNSVQPVNQIITSTSSNQTLTQTRTESKKVHELIENPCANSVAENESPLPPARRKSLNNEHLVTEPTTHRNFGDKSNLARKTAELSTTEVANSPLITEDEDEGDTIYLMNKKRVLRKSGPLNLATEKHQPAVHSRLTTKRTLPSRPTATPLITSNTQTDPGPPPAHPLNLHHSKRGQSTTRKQPKRPLNKPPNTPKNGEKFAEELKAQLKRLTNLEILDLRKRNSLGHTLIRPTPLQKSTADMKQALQEKLQIEECIQYEILRRDLVGESHGLHEEVEENENGDVTVECEIGDDLIFNELPSAPDVFKDNAITNVTRSKSTLSQLIRRSRHSSSLVGDNSTERVSFLSPTTINYNTTQDKKCRNRKKKEEQLPEITQKYLEIHKKSKRRKSNISKRSLYSKGDSAPEDTGPAVNVSPERENCPSSTIEPLSSPPTVSKICSLHIPSPPPPFHISPTPSRAPSPNLPLVVSPIPPPPSFAVSTAPMDECISPPAPFLYNCSDNNRSGKSTGSSVTKTATQVACQTDDDALFKRPTVPVPRVLPKAKAKGAKKARTNVTASNDAIATETQPSDKVELRRSKRGQVPIKTNNFLISLYKQVQDRRDRNNEKRKMSRYLSSDACNEMSMPAASSTVNNTKAKAGGRSNRKKKVTRTFSYLGETNTTSETVLTRISRIENSSANQLQAIAEARMESDSEIVAEANAVYSPATTDSETFPTNTQTKKTKAPAKKRGKPKEKRNNANAVSSPATTDSETFPTNTQTKKTKAPAKKRGRPNEKRNNANAVSSPATTDSETFPTNPPSKETKEPKKKRGTPKGKRNNPNQKQKQTDAVADFELQVQKNTATATVTAATAATQAAAVVDESMELPRNSRPENVMETENRIGVLECSRVSLPIPPPLDKLNEMFDQLKNAANNSSEHTTPTPMSTSDSSSSVTRSSRTRRLRVRLRRLRDNTTSATTSNAPTPQPASTSTQAESARDELSSWLKNVGYLRSATNTGGLFMDMRTSTAGNLFFTELDGIDYAFYDTQNSNIGYLRFKPLQSKPLKRTKKYPLQFVVFSGLFSFSTDRDHATLGIGDMVSINIGCRYKIDNLEEDIGIIMVFRQ
ncbi:uncharacterized protein LOC128869609 [Anastrepha ludens]|uniref:uncharacterized protein LOC128869609 n=1 Tax=Anastrepha ludens TaxID=28586 RepID=UPI0023B12431|nr:uncharacterized protein LOC128869609 [Anastrepha ludens]